MSLISPATVALALSAVPIAPWPHVNPLVYLLPQRPSAFRDHGRIKLPHSCIIPESTTIEPTKTHHLPSIALLLSLSEHLATPYQMDPH